MPFLCDLRWIAPAIKEKPSSNQRDNQIGRSLFHQREHSQLLSLLYPVPDASGRG